MARHLVLSALNLIYKWYSVTSDGNKVRVANRENNAIDCRRINIDGGGDRQTYL